MNKHSNYLHARELVHALQMRHNQRYFELPDQEG